MPVALGRYNRTGLRSWSPRKLSLEMDLLLSASLCLWPGAGHCPRSGPPAQILGRLGQLCASVQPKTPTVGPLAWCGRGPPGGLEPSACLGGHAPCPQVGSHLSLPLDRALGLPPANHRISESRAQPCRPSPCQHRAQPGPRWCGMPGCSLAAAVIRHEACGGCGWQGVVGMPPGSQARPPRGGGHEGRPWPFWLEHCTGVCAPTLSAWHTGLSRHVCPKLSPVGWGRELHRPPSLWGA